MKRQMPSDRHVRDVDDNLIACLKRRAAWHDRWTEAEQWKAEHREILRHARATDVEPLFSRAHKTVLRTTETSRSRFCPVPKRGRFPRSFAWGVAKG